MNFVPRIRPADGGGKRAVALGPGDSKGTLLSPLNRCRGVTPHAPGHSKGWVGVVWCTPGGTEG